MDGQGTPGDKLQTWEAVTRAAPPKVFFGWKNFYVKDHPDVEPAADRGYGPAPVHDLLPVTTPFLGGRGQTGATPAGRRIVTRRRPARAVRR